VWSLASFELLVRFGALKIGAVTENCVLAESWGRGRNGVLAESWGRGQARNWGRGPIKKTPKDSKLSERANEADFHPQGQGLLLQLLFLCLFSLHSRPVDVYREHVPELDIEYHVCAVLHFTSFIYSSYSYSYCTPSFQTAAMQTQLASSSSSSSFSPHSASGDPAPYMGQGIDRHARSWSRNARHGIAWVSVIHRTAAGLSAASYIFSSTGSSSPSTLQHPHTVTRSLPVPHLSITAVHVVHLARMIPSVTCDS
jgi:hypothetical protein